MRSQRSNFLIHWTGRDKNKEFEASDWRNIPKKLEDIYFERLTKTLNTGLWLKVPDGGEKVNGSPRSFLNYKNPMTCFTETRVSLSAQHAKAYGYLGFIFDRKFVLDRNGAPVFYVRNHDNETIVTNLNSVINLLNGKNKVIKKHSKKFNKEFKKQHDSLALVITFLKRMSNHKKDDFNFLHENEWRIVHLHNKSYIKDNVAYKKNVPSGPPYYIPFVKKDLKGVVLPNEKIKKRVLADKKCSAFLKGKHILTLNDCINF